jgi:Ca-activated chloride channel family protein
MKKVRVGAVRNDRAFAMTLAFTIVVTAVLAFGNRLCDSVVVTIASSQEKSLLLTDIADAYNDNDPSVDGKCVRINVVEKFSGYAQAALAEGWDTSVDGAYPDVWAPASTVWPLLLRQQRAAKNAPSLLPDEAARSIIQSPLVIAMPKKMAVALGWPDQPIGWSALLALARDPRGWGAIDHPEWGLFRLGKTNPHISTSGLHALIGTYFAATEPRTPVESDLRDKEVLDFVRGLESSAIHYGDTVSTFLVNMHEEAKRGRGPMYVSAIAVEEKRVWDYNHGPVPGDLPPAESLVAVYPSEGTLMHDHPYLILNAPWVTDAKRRAAADFLTHLLKPEIQNRFTAGAYRDSLGKPGPEISPENGLLQGPVKVLPPPAPAVIEGIQKSWSDVRRKARVLVAIDISETMGDRVDLRLRTKLDLVKAATAALDQLVDDDQVSLWTFSTGLPGGVKFKEVVPMSRMGDRRGDLRAAIDQLRPVGGGRTPLYAATRAAVEAVTERFDADRINAVILLTDGHNEDPSDSNLTTLLRDLQLQRENAVVRVFTVGYGADKDAVNVLTLIARASRGAFYPAEPGSIADVLTDVLSNF